MSSIALKSVSLKSNKSYVKLLIDMSFNAITGAIVLANDMYRSHERFHKALLKITDDYECRRHYSYLVQDHYEAFYGAYNYPTRPARIVINGKKQKLLPLQWEKRVPAPTYDDPTKPIVTTASAKLKLKKLPEAFVKRNSRRTTVDSKLTPSTSGASTLTSTSTPKIRNKRNLCQEVNERKKLKRNCTLKSGLTDTCDDIVELSDNYEEKDSSDDEVTPLMDVRKKKSSNKLCLQINFSITFRSRTSRK